MPSPKLLVVIATYNEMENLPALVDRLLRLLPGATVLVIDDNSPDGTGQWCVDSAREQSHLKCLIRTGKLGLGSATLHGLQYGITHDFDLIATMDGDFSHQPEDLVVRYYPQCHKATHPSMVPVKLRG